MMEKFLLLWEKLTSEEREQVIKFMVEKNYKYVKY